MPHGTGKIFFLEAKFINLFKISQEAVSFEICSVKIMLNL